MSPIKTLVLKHHSFKISKMNNEESFHENIYDNTMVKKFTKVSIIN